MVSHYNVIANILQAATYERVGRTKLGISTQVMLGLLPLSHIYGLTVVALLSQFRGDEVIILPRFELSTFLRAIERFRIERLYVVPPIVIQMMSNKEKCDKADFSSVSSLYSGAAPLGSELIEQFLARYPKVRIVQSYGRCPHQFWIMQMLRQAALGLTEVSPLVVVTSELDFSIGSSGSFLPGIKAKVIDPEGRQVTTHGCRGELLVQGPNVTMGYLNNVKASSETFVWDQDGQWLKTGDEVLIRNSSQGHEHLVVIDRIKELIKVKVRRFIFPPCCLPANRPHRVIRLPPPSWKLTFSITPSSQTVQ